MLGLVIGDADGSSAPSLDTFGGGAVRVTSDVRPSKSPAGAYFGPGAVPVGSNLTCVVHQLTIINLHEINFK